ncbi:MAG: hypothetical protein IKE89_04625 [Bacilli bacterium]|nr:hypothetical protein [Bacilli bacterium]
MIGNLNYDQVSQVVEVLKKCNETLSVVPEEQRDTTFQEFFSVVEGYYKYLETLVQMNKDADEALKELIKN